MCNSNLLKTQTLYYITHDNVRRVRTRYGYYDYEHCGRPNAGDEGGGCGGGDPLDI